VNTIPSNKFFEWVAMTSRLKCSIDHIPFQSGQRNPLMQPKNTSSLLEGLTL